MRTKNQRKQFPSISHIPLIADALFPVWRCLSMSVHVMPCVACLIVPISLPTRCIKKSKKKRQSACIGPAATVCHTWPNEKSKGHRSTKSKRTHFRWCHHSSTLIAALSSGAICNGGPAVMASCTIWSTHPPSPVSQVSISCCSSYISVSNSIGWSPSMSSWGEDSSPSCWGQRLAWQVQNDPADKARRILMDSRQLLIHVDHLDVSSWFMMIQNSNEFTMSLGGNGRSWARIQPRFTSTSQFTEVPKYPKIPQAFPSDSKRSPWPSYAFLWSWFEQGHLHSWQKKGIIW